MNKLDIQTIEQDFKQAMLPLFKKSSMEIRFDRIYFRVQEHDHCAEFWTNIPEIERSIAIGKMDQIFNQMKERFSKELRKV